MTSPTETSARVRLSIDERGIAEVALNRPEKMNALDTAMFEAINRTIAQLAEDRRVRVVVLHGEGRAFCAGLDLASFVAMGESERAQRSHDAGNMNDLAARTHGLANAFQQVAWGWHALPVPVIAAVHGVAYGGGLQIALGADIRLVTPDAKLSVMEIKWGLVPDMAGMALAAGLVRGDQLRELVYTGRVVSGEEAVALGLATRACADPLAEARTIAAGIATRSPQAIRGAKRLCNLLPQTTPAEVLLAEAREQQKVMGGAQQQEAVRAGMEGRAPLFKDE